MRLGRREGDPEAPDAAHILLNTKMVNDYVGAVYTLEDVANDPALRDPLLAGLIGAIRSGMMPPEQKQKRKP